MAEDKGRSLRALDLLNFCNAGIQTGLGPFIAIFYTAVRHWNPGQIGVLLACQSLAGILIQPAVGRWVDESHSKRLITGIAAVIVSISAVCIAIVPQFALQVVVQLVIGVAVTAFPPAMSAFALGMVDKSDVSRRVARNETYTHAGNFLFALAAGLVGTFYDLKWIFYTAGIFAFGMAISVLLIKGSHVSYEAARAASEESGGERKAPASARQLFTDKRVVTFAAAVVLFYCANAATLPLVAQILTGANKNGRGAAWQIAAAVMVAEAVMVGVATYSGRLADRIGRKPLFLIAFTALVLRNALSVVSHDRYYLIGLQALDGVAAAIYGVLLTLITADLARGTGRFNFLGSTVQSAMGLGGFLSNMAFGFVAKSMGFNAAFWALSGVAALGGTLFQMKMPETRPEPEKARTGDQSAAAA